LTELDRRSQETLRRLEAHIRNRELELKEKQEEELSNIKKSLLDVMKEKEGSYYQRKNEIMPRITNNKIFLSIIFIRKFLRNPN
jgi:hypothetical protein